jgi:transcriptional regulator with XRE-family HTH domain
MDRVKIGNTFRTIRVELRLRQSDVAERAGLSQQTVSDLECGRFGRLSIDAYCRIAETIGADVPLTPRWRGPRLDRLLDRRHALLQNRAVELLASLSWQVRTEFSFNHYGDRGSVDVLGWLPGSRALLVGEIKTEITDLQETLRVLDMKRRVVPAIARLECGWSPTAIATVLVLPDASTHRDLVERHGALVSASLPDRTWAVNHWLARPSGDLRAVMFLRNTGHGGAKWKVQPARRVRAPATTESAASDATLRPRHAQRGDDRNRAAGPGAISRPILPSPLPRRRPGST